MATKKTTLDQVVETVEKVEEIPVQQDKSAPAQEEYTLLDSKFLGDSAIYVAEVVENIPAAVGGEESSYSSVTPASSARGDTGLHAGRAECTTRGTVGNPPILEELRRM